MLPVVPVYFAVTVVFAGISSNATAKVVSAVMVSSKEVLPATEVSAVPSPMVTDASLNPSAGATVTVSLVSATTLSPVLTSVSPALTVIVPFAPTV